MLPCGEVRGLAKETELFLFYCGVARRMRSDLRNRIGGNRNRNGNFGG